MPRTEKALAPPYQNRILADGFIRQIEWREQIGSTNDLAKQFAAKPDATTPLLVGTWRQTAGRGRGDRRWWSAEGSLTFSILLCPPRLKSAENTAPSFSLRTALAVRSALQSFAPDATVQVKWPNDVVCNGRKICGILIETPATQPRRVIIGIGVNVNNTLALTPDSVTRRATSLADEMDHPLVVEEVLLEILSQMRDGVSPRGLAQSLPRAWNEFCLLSGRSIEVQTGGRRTKGVCRGVDDIGALLIENEDGLQRCHSGEVVVMD